MENTARQKWSLTQEALDGLLRSLSPDRETAAVRYVEIRAHLVRLFEWRGCSTPDEYADEAITRCARKIGDGEEIRDVSTYCIGIARMLLREMHRAPELKAVPLEKAPEPQSLPTDLNDGVDEREECLRRCLSHLSGENRDLILRYYQGDKGDKIKSRKGLARLFGLPASTLRMRALRLREKLQTCSEECLRTKGKA